ncbi:hypothetical protein COT62_01465 [Candidatus Roizmanbacteria bacterium CG09_land_8_20_14_0_10_41_9]|uniref:Uncharacterized protein n=1 Tax=Candidatus Roizmanbacteria bacterium CG09_land_8_20_14_0_10_41_9 TaxID=1974850 RepID=A0A2H0WT70_9BACT|nr:MAG: hypothetical protein COT62_01465 [Candidatus Roizmanbacteria bacterium CG09_land_8_20_14_0_10_41_9]
MNKKELLLISIGVFLTVVAWLIADIYHAATEEKIKNKISLPQIVKYQTDEDVLKMLLDKK